MIGVICFNNLRYSQFLYKYTFILDQQDIAYEVLFWNRDGENNEVPSNWIYYNETINTFSPFYKKIFKFINYVSFLKKKIKEKKYEKLIILTTQSAIPLFPLLIFKYANRYIFDYRDITFERFFFYKLMVKKIVKKSFCTMISSDGFKQILGDYTNVITIHNTRNFKQVERNLVRCRKLPIKVVYWGMVRQLEFNYHLCDLFEKDNRFELVYHGAGFHKELVDYCKKNNYYRISISGAYTLDEVNDFVQSTDIILNAYANDAKQTLAITVKFYDSISFKVPMIVTSKSHMADLVSAQKLGFIVDWNDDKCLDKLYSDIISFDWTSYFKNVVDVAKDVQGDDAMFKMRVLDFLQSSEMK